MGGESTSAVSGAPAVPAGVTEGGPSRAGGTAVAASMVLGACVSVQFGAALAVHLFPVAGPWGTSAVRLAIAAIIMVVVIRPAVSTWNRPQWRAVLALGVVFGGMNGMFYAAIDRIPLSVAVSVEFIGPLGLAAVLSRRRVDLVWVATAVCGLGLLGIEGVVGSEGLDPLGIAFAAGAGACWAGYILATERVGRMVPGAGGLSVALIVGAVVLLPMGASGAAAVFTDGRALALGLGTAVLASLIPYSLELGALRRLPRNVFGILLSLEPALAGLAGWLLLHQSVGPLRMAAICLVIVASVGTTLTESAYRRRMARPGERESREKVVGQAE